MKTLEKLTDEELAMRYVDGNNRAFDVLLNRTQQNILANPFHFVLWNPSEHQAAQENLEQEAEHSYQSEGLIGLVALGELLYVHLRFFQLVDVLVDVLQFLVVGFSVSVCVSVGFTVGFSVSVCVSVSLCDSVSVCSSEDEVSGSILVSTSFLYPSTV